MISWKCHFLLVSLLTILIQEGIGAKALKKEDEPSNAKKMPEGRGLFGDAGGLFSKPTKPKPPPPSPPKSPPPSKKESPTSLLDLTLGAPSKSKIEETTKKPKSKKSKKSKSKSSKKSSKKDLEETEDDYSDTQNERNPPPPPPHLLDIKNRFGQPNQGESETRQSSENENNRDYDDNTPQAQKEDESDLWPSKNLYTVLDGTKQNDDEGKADSTATVNADPKANANLAQAESNKDNSQIKNQESDDSDLWGEFKNLYNVLNGDPQTKTRDETTDSSLAKLDAVAGAGLNANPDAIHDPDSGSLLSADAMLCLNLESNAAVKTNANAELNPACKDKESKEHETSVPQLLGDTGTDKDGFGALFPEATDTLKEPAAKDNKDDDSLLNEIPNEATTEPGAKVPDYEGAKKDENNDIIFYDYSGEANNKATKEGVETATYRPKQKRKPGKSKVFALAKNATTASVAKVLATEIMYLNAKSASKKKYVSKSAQHTAGTLTMEKAESLSEFKTQRHNWCGCGEGACEEYTRCKIMGYQPFCCQNKCKCVKVEPYMLETYWKTLKRKFACRSLGCLSESSAQTCYDASANEFNCWTHYHKEQMEKYLIDWGSSEETQKKQASHSSHTEVKLIGSGYYNYSKKKEQNQQAGSSSSTTQHKLVGSGFYNESDHKNKKDRLKLEADIQTLDGKDKEHQTGSQSFTQHKLVGMGYYNESERNKKKEIVELNVNDDIQDLDMDRNEQQAEDSSSSHYKLVGQGYLNKTEGVIKESLQSDVDSQNAEKEANEADAIDWDIESDEMDSGTLREGKEKLLNEGLDFFNAEEKERNQKADATVDLQTDAEKSLKEEGQTLDEAIKETVDGVNNKKKQVTKEVAEVDAELQSDSNKSQREREKLLDETLDDFDSKEKQAREGSEDIEADIETGSDKSPREKLLDETLDIVSTKEKKLKERADIDVQLQPGYEKSKQEHQALDAGVDFFNAEEKEAKEKGDIAAHLKTDLIDSPEKIEKLLDATLDVISIDEKKVNEVAKTPLQISTVPVPPPRFGVKLNKKQEEKTEMPFPKNHTAKHPKHCKKDTEKKREEDEEKEEKTQSSVRIKSTVSWDDGWGADTDEDDDDVEENAKSEECRSENVDKEHERVTEVYRNESSESDIRTPKTSNDGPETIQFAYFGCRH